jgi:hypothetical protein
MELHFRNEHGILFAKMKGDLAREFVAEMHETPHIFDFTTKRFVGEPTPQPVFVVKGDFKLTFQSQLEIPLWAGNYIQIKS